MMSILNYPSELVPWLSCTKCGLHHWRKNVVIGRGVWPADILFIGEGPGKTENLFGQPFCGPAGRILDKGIIYCQNELHLSEFPRYFIANSVACRPTDSTNGFNREPSEEEFLACWPLLKRIHQIVQPKRVVFLGKVPMKYCKEAFPNGVSIYHPSYILKSGGESSPVFLTFVRQLMDVFQSIQSKSRIRKVAKA